jgi:STE24 endopeptidase
LVLSGLGSVLAFVLIQWSAAWWLPWIGLTDLDDPAGFPTLMLALSLIGLIGLPLQSGLSRAFEWQSDRFAVALTHAPQALASALNKLGEINLADPHPPRWIVWLFYDHPPVSDRIIAAERAVPTASHSA